MAWHSLPYVSNKKHNLNVIRLISTFLFFLGLIGFIVSFSNLFHQWDVLNSVKPCFAEARTIESADLCRDYFYKSTGVALAPDRYIDDPNVNIMVAFRPIIYLFAWIVLILVSLFLYKIGDNWHFLMPKKTIPLPDYLSDKKTRK